MATECVIQDPLDSLFRRNACLPQCRRIAGIGGKTRVRVDLQNPRLALLVHAEVNPHVTPESEYFPTADGQSLEFLEQWLIGCGKVKTARRVLEFEGLLIPLGGVIDDSRLVLRKLREVDFSWRQYLRTAWAGKK